MESLLPRWNGEDHIAPPRAVKARAVSPGSIFGYGGDLADDRLGGRAWIGRGRDRPADDQIIGARLDRLGGSRDALLVAGGAARRADAWGDEDHIAADRGADAARLGGAGDETAEPERLRLLGAPPHRLDDAEAVASLHEILVVARREDRHREKLETRAGGAGDRGPHRLRVGMDGEEGRAKLGRLCGRTLDRVGDVVQLEVEKQPFAGRGGETTGEIESALGVGQLHADLIEKGGLADALDEALGLANFAHVERHDELSARQDRVHARASCAPRPNPGAMR